MLARADDPLSNASNDDVQLVRIVRHEARWSSVLGLAAAGALALAFLGGMLLLTGEALSEPDAVSLALARPLTTLQAVAGILMLSAILIGAVLTVELSRTIAALRRQHVALQAAKRKAGGFDV